MSIPHSSWAEAERRFHETTMITLKRIGKDVGVAADAGNEAAKTIIKYYAMLRRSFDPITMTLLEESIKQWQINEKTKQTKTRSA
jgi:hypothetical protein